MESIGPLEIGLIIVAIVLIFGVGKLGEVGGALGKSIHEFRKERDRKDDLPDATTAESEVVKPIARLEAGSGKMCPNCGNQMSERAKFCMACGSKL